MHGKVYGRLVTSLPLVMMTNCAQSKGILTVSLFPNAIKCHPLSLIHPRCPQQENTTEPWQCQSSPFSPRAQGAGRWEGSMVIGRGGSDRSVLECIEISGSRVRLRGDRLWLSLSGILDWRGTFKCLWTDENMPHFTVVPVEDSSPSAYDSLEGINWVDYRDTGQGYPGHGDTVSSDGKFLTNFTQTSAHQISLLCVCLCVKKGRAGGRKTLVFLSIFF